jgi:glycosyltransferase involved in cell wall biosynthesis
MRYTIITPTICRQSLLRLCESIDNQIHSDWEHLVVIDMPRDKMGRDQRRIIASIPARENRPFFYCDTRHNNYGHTCRHQIWEHAIGDYILYVDDDDYLAHKDVLRMLDSVAEPWAVFPILRYGERFLNLPPGISRTGTGMFIHKRGIGRWPDSDSYETDGLFVEELREKYAYQVLDCGPLVIQPRTSCGVSNAESWFGNKVAGLVSRWLQYRARTRTGVVSPQAKSGRRGNSVLK